MHAMSAVKFHAGDKVRLTAGNPLYGIIRAVENGLYTIKTDKARSWDGWSSICCWTDDNLELDTTARIDLTDAAQYYAALTEAS
jgi:hypothetical protein